MSFLLSRSELEAITDCKQAAGMVAWLRANGWPFVVGSKGMPKVSAEFARARLAGVPLGIGTTPAKAEPNFDALRARR